MKTEVMYLTPAMARHMLNSNTCNRPLRIGGVANLHGIWKRGEWKLTHQGIAFSDDGILRDGQHRLTFISELPEDEKVEINVTTGMANDTFGAIDQNIRRTSSDVLGISSQLAACAKMFERIYNQNQSSGSTAVTLQPYVNLINESYVSLTNFSPTVVKVWSSAAVRAAAIYSLLTGSNLDFVLVQYNALVHSKFDEMSPTAQSLVKQQMAGKIVSVRTLDLFCRSMRVFDSRKSSVSRIQINDQSASLTEVRAFIQASIFGEKKGPTIVRPKVAKPSAHYLTATR